MPARILPRFLTASCLLLLLPSSSLWSQDQPAPLPAAFFAETPSSVAAIDAYRAAVEALESEFGAYDQRLVEALQALGGRLRADGDLVAAREAYSRALQVNRINDGLYNPAQISLVETLIGIGFDLGDWSGVDRQYGYLENLFRRLYPEDDIRLEQALRTVVAWHIDASNINLDGKRIEHLRAVHRIYSTRLQVALNTVGGDDPLAEFLRNRVAMSEYHLYASAVIPTDRRRQAFYGLREKYLLSLD